MQILLKRDKRQWPPLPSPQDQSPSFPASLSSTRLLLFLLQIYNNYSTHRQEWTFNLFHFKLVCVKLFEKWELKKMMKIHYRQYLRHLKSPENAPVCCWVFLNTSISKFWKQICAWTKKYSLRILKLQWNLSILYASIV